MLLRRRRALARARRHGDLRRQVDAQPEAVDPPPRRRAAAVEDRPLADQGQDEGSRGRARGRDERAHVLQGALVRLRRRALRRRAAARDPVAPRRSVGGARCAAGCRVDARAQRRLRRGRAPRIGREARRIGAISRRDRRDPHRRTCASNIRTASGSPADPTRRRWSCCVSRPTTRRRWSGSRPSSGGCWTPRSRAFRCRSDERRSTPSPALLHVPALPGLPQTRRSPQYGIPARR